MKTVASKMKCEGLVYQNDHFQTFNLGLTIRIYGDIDYQGDVFHPIYYSFYIVTASELSTMTTSKPEISLMHFALISRLVD